MHVRVGHVRNRKFLTQMGYQDVSGRLGWLLFAYVCFSFLHSGFC